MFQTKEIDLNSSTVEKFLPNRACSNDEHKLKDGSKRIRDNQFFLGKHMEETMAPKSKSWFYV